MYSIIVVDDEDAIRMSIVRFVQTLPGFEIKGAFSNGDDAVAYIRNNPVHIVISDIRMPGISGLEFAEYINKHSPNTITIIVTGYGEFEYARKAIQFGVFHYLLKPMDFMELQDVLERAESKLNALSNSISFQEDNLRSFFHDLISGTLLLGSDEIHLRLQSLSFDKDPGAYKGCLLSVTLTESIDRNPIDELLDFIRYTLPQYQCYYVHYTDEAYTFIILSKDHVPDISTPELENAVSSYLFFSCQFLCHSHFNSFYELHVSHEQKEISTQNESIHDQSNSDDLLIQSVLNYINEHYGECISREDVANVAHLSSSYFSRFFKRNMGMSFLEYLTKVRMEKAVELLATNMTINEISQQVGYLSRNRFCVNFQQYTGYAPSDYRKLIPKKENTYES